MNCPSCNSDNIEDTEEGVIGKQMSYGYEIEVSLSKYICLNCGEEFWE